MIVDKVFSSGELLEVIDLLVGPKPVATCKTVEDTVLRHLIESRVKRKLIKKGSYHVK